MTNAVPHISTNPESPHDPRITDAVVRAVVTAGLKAPPHIDDFCRAMLGAALPLLDGASPRRPDPVKSDDTIVFLRSLDEMSANWLARNHPDFAGGNVGSQVPRRDSLEKAHRIVTEIVVHGFENDEDAERAIRPFEPMIARALDAEADRERGSGDVSVFWSAPGMRGQSVFRNVGPMTVDRLEAMRADIRAANHGERVIITGWQRFEA